MPVEERTLREYKKDNFTLSKEVRDGQVFLTIIRDGHKVVTARGTSTREAARWLARHVNRLARHTEDLLVEVGFLTAEEIDAAVLDDEDRVVDKT